MVPRAIPKSKVKPTTILGPPVRTLVAHKASTLATSPLLVAIDFPLTPETRGSANGSRAP